MNKKNSDIPINLERKWFDRVEQTLRLFTPLFSPSSYDRVDGITAVTLTKDEPLCYKSVESILPFVDEVIVIDCGDTDAMLPSSDKIQYRRSIPHQNTQFKQALLLSKYRWILRWDADFLATDTTKSFLQHIRTLKQGYWQIKCLVANKGKQGIKSFQNEAYVFTYHPLILSADHLLLSRLVNYVIRLIGHIPNRLCYNMLPWFFGMKKTDTVFAEHHFENKTDKRKNERDSQTHWNLLSDLKRAQYGSFDNYCSLFDGDN